MKCPKCHYLSFDPEPRCRNCGYTLSLDEDLAIQPAPVDTNEPLIDLELMASTETASAPAAVTAPPPVRRQPTPPAVVESTRRSRTSAPGPFDDGDNSVFLSETDFELRGRQDEPAAAAPTHVTPDPPRSRASSRQPLPPATAELPLFVKGTNVDPAPAVSPQPPATPLIAPPARGERMRAPIEDLVDVIDPVDPGPPLAVRRQKQADTPISGRLESPARLGPLDRDLLEGLQRIENFEQANATAETRRAQLENSAGPLKRLIAASFDSVLLAGLSAGLVWITLRWCDLSWAQVSVLPILPFALFILLLVVGYLFLFTAASGQTIGKMIAGIRVVDAGVPGTGQDPVSMQQAMYRGLAAVPSVLLLGAGLIPAFFGDERAFHDRLTKTRVVRA